MIFPFLCRQHDKAAQESTFVGGANVVGPATRSRRRSDIHYGFHLLCPELWMETVESKYMFTVKAVALKNLDLWPVSLFHRGKKWAHSGNVFAVKKQQRNELFKLERGLILEICPQITLNAPLCIKKKNNWHCKKHLLFVVCFVK